MSSVRLMIAAKEPGKIGIGVKDVKHMVYADDPIRGRISIPWIVLHRRYPDTSPRQCLITNKVIKSPNKDTNRILSTSSNNQWDGLIEPGAPIIASCLWPQHSN